MRSFKDLISDPSAIEAVVRFLVERRARATVSTLAGIVELEAEPAEAPDALAFTIAFGSKRALPPAPYVITASGYNALYRIAARGARVEHGKLLLPMPDAIEQVRMRRSQRVPIESGLRVSFDSLVDGQRIERRVLDLTHTGLSFSADARCAALEPGAEIPLLLVERPNAEPIALRATVKSRRFDAEDDSGAGIIGCSVEPLGERQTELWWASCDALLFPNTRRGAAEVWSVYRDSGYFGLSDTLDGFEHLRASYIEASRALASAPELGCQARWPSSGPAVATVTNLKLYPSCWFSYHLAVRPERAVRAPEVLRELYRQYVEHSLALPGTRWQMAYVQESAHWSMRVHVDIPRRFCGPGEALIREFRALQVRTVGSLPPPPPGVMVGVASTLEIEASMLALGARLPKEYCEALEYTPDVERFRLTELSAAWARHGMERDRELLVARRDGAVIAVGVLEAAQPGLHLFGLLDTLRLYSIDSDVEPKRRAAAFDALLDHARVWFRQRGRRSFCYLEEEGELIADGQDIKAMSRALLTLLSVERLPEMLEELYQQTASEQESSHAVHSTNARAY
jgi:hypothetical protein